MDSHLSQHVVVSMDPEVQLELIQFGLIVTSSVVILLFSWGVKQSISAK